MSYHPDLSQFEFCQQHPEQIYADSAASCQIPEVVLQRMLQYYRGEHANVHRASYALGRTATELLESARATCANFIGAQAEQVALLSSTTAALNGIAEQLPVDWQAGDEILLSAAEHHANILPWQRLARRYQLNLRWLPVDPNTGELGDWQKLLTHRTRVVSITMASNVTGAVFPLSTLLAEAEKLGAYTIVDAAQAAAHVAIDVKQLHCDALVFSAHKTYGVSGCAITYLSDKLRDKMQPFYVGGGMVTRVTQADADWLEGIHKFEAGTPNTAAAIAAATALDWLTQQQGLHQYLQQLRQQLVVALQQRNWLQVLPAGPISTPVVAFYSKEFHAHDIATWLDQHQISVRAGQHCAQPLLQSWELPSVVRVSLGAYNTAAQIEKIIETLDAGWAIFGSDLE